MTENQQDQQPKYILAINCGSSSIKSKLYLRTQHSEDSDGARKGRDGVVGNESAPGKEGGLLQVAEATIKNIAAKGEKVKVNVRWLELSSDGVSEGERKTVKLGEDKEAETDDVDGAAVDYASLPPLLFSFLTASAYSASHPNSATHISSTPLGAILRTGFHKDQITHIAHRIVHGGPSKEVIRITREHDEGLREMDKLSAFAPLHNHSAVLAVRSCLSALPNHTSVLTFDTLFHSTLPIEVYTYALPPSEEETPIPIRKYGFHGLSYMSILDNMAKKLGKKKEDVSIVVAHLGSGGSTCCIRKGKSVDTSMGLTPLEGLVGGTRSGSIDPTTVFHTVKDCGSDAGLEGINVTRAEASLNKKSGLTALAGTANFGTITTRMTDPSSCSPSEHTSASLAYAVYVDRLMHYLTSYLSKLFSTLPAGEVDGLVFSGGIGEKSDYIRADVAKRLEWIGAEIDPKRNQAAGKGGKDGGEEEVVTCVGDQGKIKLWVVQTDEELVCAKMAME